MDCDKQNLFPEINPNLDEIAEMENTLDADEVIKDDVDFSKDKSTHNDIFVKGKQNIKMKIKEPTDTITENDVKTKKKGRDYSHLAAARKKGAETRKAKAEAKRRAKEEAKLEKEKQKQLRREATKERNREKARQRYYKQKEQKKNDSIEAAKVIEQKTRPRNKYEKQNSKYSTPKPDGMSFNTFAKYMMRYEDMKEKYNQHKKSTRKKQMIPTQKPKPKPKPSFHPPNYPLANIYNPSQKYKDWTGF